MKTLLAAVDLSNASRPVLAQTAALARALGASVEAIHVAEPIVTGVPIGAAMDVIEVAPPVATPEILEQKAADLRRMLEEEATGLPSASTTVYGMAADEIVERAKTLGAGMIVLGSHGHGALYHLFAGSVVNAVLKRSPIPVLVVPVGERK